MTTPTLPAFAEVMDYLDGYTNYERVTDYRFGPATLGTERIERLLERLGQPQQSVPALHIAGTKGKGSIAHLTARLLEAHGLRVGLYTSPHIESIRERIRVNGEPLGEERFCECFARVRAAVEALRSDPALKPPTYFEIITALAFVAFEEAEVNAAVLETGLGGRLDATNVSPLPVVATAISPISIDHTKQLGGDLVSIAGEKAGILRPGVPLVLAPQAQEVARFLSSRAAKLGCRLYRVGRDLKARRAAAPRVDAPEEPQELELSSWRGTHSRVSLSLLGEHQVDNAAVALGLAELFLENQNAGPVRSDCLTGAWRDLVLPGRIEVVGRRPWIILDGAHNPAATRALAQTLPTRFSTDERALLFAAARDKDIAGMLEIIVPLASTLTLTTIDSPRCMDLESIRAQVADRYRLPVQIERNPLDAVRRAHEQVSASGLVCITGSLYLVGEVRKYALGLATKENIE